MEESGWLKVLLDNLQDDMKEIKDDIHEIRVEMEGLKDFKAKVIGGSMALSFVITGFVQLVLHWIK